MFRLTTKESAFLRSQSVTLEDMGPSRSRSQSVILKRGQNIKYPPYAFTEQGVAMLSSVLNSSRAAEFANLRSQFATSSLQANDFKEDNLNWPQLATSSSRHHGATYRPLGLC